MGEDRLCDEALSRDDVLVAKLSCNLRSSVCRLLVEIVKFDTLNDIGIDERTGEPARDTGLIEGGFT